MVTERVQEKEEEVEKERGQLEIEINNLYQLETKEETPYTVV